MPLSVNANLGDGDGEGMEQVEPNPISFEGQENPTPQAHSRTVSTGGQTEPASRKHPVTESRFVVEIPGQENTVCTSRLTLHVHETPLSF